MRETVGPQRIVSFLPSATEMVCALGLSDRLVGVTHECDYPPEVRGKPVVVRPAVPLEGRTPREIDTVVRERLRDGSSLYALDERLLRALAPDLIVAQDLCEVCAPSGNDVTQVLKSLPNPPEILYLTPKCIDDILGNLRELGDRTRCAAEAAKLIAWGRDRLNTIERRSRSSPDRPRVFCMEWVDPIYCSGHWVPEMVELAGGIDALSEKGTDSSRVSWQAVRDWAPEVLIVSPCGCHLAEALGHTPRLARLPGWDEVPAVEKGRVSVVDASSYFARPGPRIVDGVALLAHLIHPELFRWNGPSDAYLMLERALRRPQARGLEELRTPVRPLKDSKFREYLAHVPTSDLR